MVIAVLGVAAYFAPVQVAHSSSLQFGQVQTDKSTTIRQERTAGTTRGAWFVEMVTPL